MLTKKVVKKKKILRSNLVGNKLPTKFSRNSILVYSRHPSHKGLRRSMAMLPFRSMVRLGSTTRKGDEVSVGGSRIECNTIEGVKNSSSKLLMKQCFTRAGIKTAEWCQATEFNTTNPQFEYPVVVKGHFGSRNSANTYITGKTEMTNWLAQHKGNLGSYIVEKYYNYVREYRLHVTSEGCFYTCRKMLKLDTPKDKTWFRNDSNCTWYVETNPGFDKPANWKEIEAECVKALKSLGLDIACFDLRCQSAKDSKGNVRNKVDYIIIESGSAPGMDGAIVLSKYKEEIPKVLQRKFNNLKNKI